MTISLAALKALPSPPPQSRALFLGTSFDEPYIPALKPLFAGTLTLFSVDKITLLTQLEMVCERKSITKVVTTSTAILQKLVESRGTISTTPSLSNYEGSLFNFRGIEIVFISPLAQLFTVSYGKHLCERWVSKVIRPESWAEATEFSWEILQPSTIEAAYQRISQAYAISVDIETFRNPLSIRCISYTGVYIDPTNGSISTHSTVLPIDSEWAVVWMRKFNELPIRKIFQNGKYDNSYLLRYGTPVTEWYHDTAHYMHSWYSELPKDLAFLNAYFLREVVYWKDLAKTSDILEYYKYNAMDGWATANVWIQQLLSAPDWARRNYTLEFPLIYPCLLAEMTGILRDMDKLPIARAEVVAEEKKLLIDLTKSIGAKNFNPGSPVQVKTLLEILGCKDIKSTKEIEIAKAKFRHPFIAYILDLVLDIRGLRKLNSTYLRTDDDSTGVDDGTGHKEFYGTVLYSLNPHGTDTGRLASREHHFWCGLQIHNIPRDKSVKQTLRCPDGFFMGECDLKQAESWDTAYISGDKELITAVNSPRDFHASNAEKFFGTAYKIIYDDSIRKVLNKPLRDLSKRTNHGANYVMGPGVLADTMGLKNVFAAASMLKLPYSAPLKITEYLLERFHITYPDLRGKFYPAVVNEIGRTGMLVSRAFHHTAENLRTIGSGSPSDDEQQRKDIERNIDRNGDWARYCFKNPKKNKRDLNAYAAHCPQSLNSRTLNEAWLRVFYEVAIPNPKTFRLYAQIHDSILFAYAKEHEYLAERVKECMEIPVTVRDVSGNYRTFTVPADLKLGQNGGTRYWSELE